MSLLRRREHHHVNGIAGAEAVVKGESVGTGWHVQSSYLEFERHASATRNGIGVGSGTLLEGTLCDAPVSTILTHLQTVDRIVWAVRVR